MIEKIPTDVMTVMVVTDVMTVMVVTDVMIAMVVTGESLVGVAVLMAGGRKNR